MKKKILIQLDTDAHASVFDGVVAVDAGVDHLFQYENIRAADVRGLVHGAMFTRGPQDLSSTAIFVGGSDAEAGLVIAEEARSVLFEPFKVSLMIDSNGCNSTAAAAVLSAAKHLDLANCKALVLAATGAVGQAVCLLVSSLGGQVFVGSRSMARAEEGIERLKQRGCKEDHLHSLSIESKSSLNSAIADSDVVFACGAAGVELMDSTLLRAGKKLRVAIDLNAVPPAGIEGIQVTDKAVERDGRFNYGALGVGGLKMKIHKQAIQQLFTSNGHFIDAQEMMKIGQSLLST